jgi:chemotaxis protein methyltransferase CheR
MLALPQEQFALFRDLIDQRCGIQLDDTKKESLQRSLSRRMEDLGLNRFEEYHEHLRGRASDEEFRRLVNLVTINETSFFRYPAQFEILRNHILPALIAERQAQDQRIVRIWSAGCSTGEEPYSVAILLLEMRLYVTYPDWNFEIVGTDLNTEVLKSARLGLFSQRSVRNLEGDVLRRYFSAEGKRFRLNEDVIRRVQFRYSNLIQEPFPPPELKGQDVIFFENVSIYFRPQIARRLMYGMLEALNEGGYLFLGHSESLGTIEGGFAIVEHDGVFCYRKSSAPPVVSEHRVTERRKVNSLPPDGVERRATERRRLLLSKYGRVGFAQSILGPAKKRAAEHAATQDQSMSHFDACLNLFRAGAWEQAEASLAALIRSSPTFIRAHLLLGSLYANQARYDEALALAGQVLRLDELEAKAHLLVGMIEARRGRQQEALQALRRSLYLDNSLALAHFCLGNLYLEKGDNERASREYDNVLRSHARNTLDLPCELAVDLTVEQLVNFCRRNVQLLGQNLARPQV